MKHTNTELLKIWDENSRQLIRGINAYENLSLEEKSRIFDLIENEEHLKLNLQKIKNDS